MERPHDPVLGPASLGDRTVIPALLAESARLLLEYNESTTAIRREVTWTARAVGAEVDYVDISYGGVTVGVAGANSVSLAVEELRYNTALLTRVHETLTEVRAGTLTPAESLSRLEGLKTTTPPHPAWVSISILGIAGASLARLLGADLAGVVVAGAATALGLLVRKGLGRRSHGPLTLTFTACLIGAVLGGLAVRFGWTRSPELALIVPALMVVPGPHLVNGLLDLIDNHLPMSGARLGLAAAILAAGTFGLVAGIQLTLPRNAVGAQGAAATPPGFAGVLLLAGLVSCGFAVFYNATWRQVGIAAVGGMAGNGLRDVALDAGIPLDAATFLGGVAVGVASAAMARCVRTPVAIVAFAGAVTMMPGTYMYQALGGLLRLARLDPAPAVTAEFSTNLARAFVVVTGLVLGLVLGARGTMAVRLPASRRDR